MLGNVSCDNDRCIFHYVLSCHSMNSTDTIHDELEWWGTMLQYNLSCRNSRWHCFVECDTVLRLINSVSFASTNWRTFFSIISWLVYPRRLSWISVSLTPLHNMLQKNESMQLILQQLGHSTVYFQTFACPWNLAQYTQTVSPQSWCMLLSLKQATMVFSSLTARGYIAV